MQGSSAPALAPCPSVPGAPCHNLGAWGGGGLAGPHAALTGCANSIPQQLLGGGPAAAPPPKVAGCPPARPIPLSPRTFPVQREVLMTSRCA